MTMNPPGPYNYAPHPPNAPRPSRKGLWIGLGAGALILIVIAAAARGGKDEPETKASPKSATVEAEPTRKADQDSKPAGEPDARLPVTVTAARASYEPGVLDDEDASFKAVQVVVHNVSKKEVTVNPLYFSGTDANGFKHSASLATGDDVLDHADLAPGQSVKGLVVFEDVKDIVEVEFNDAGFGTTYSAKVR